jgi:hypothetical protein
MVPFMVKELCSNDNGASDKEFILDYPGWYNVVTRVFIRERGRQDQVHRRATQLSLNLFTNILLVVEE